MDPTFCCEDDSSTSCCGNENSTFHFILGTIQGILDASGSLGTIAVGGSTIYTSTSFSSTTTSSASPTTSLSALSPSSITAATSSAASSQAVPPSTATPPYPTVIGLSVGTTLAAVTAAAAFGALFFHRRRRQRLELQQKPFAEMPAGPGITNGARYELPGGMEASGLTADRPAMRHMK